MTRATVEVSTPSRALAPTGGYLEGYSHTLNPYGGCAFGRGGCPFCYVRQSPPQRFAPRGADGRALGWGHWLRVKQGLAERLARELRSPAARGYRVFCGSATDPYQGAEARWRLTRGCLEALAVAPVAALVLQTRSVLVERDLALLAALPFVRLHLTVETDDLAVHRALTASSPPPARRLATARAARRAGISTTITVSPLLPLADPEAFAAALAEVADRVIVDTLADGDGAGGRRSRSNGMPAALAALGHPGFMDDPGPVERLLSALRRRLPADRVGVGRAGFRAAAEELGSR